MSPVRGPATTVTGPLTLVGSGRPGADAGGQSGVGRRELVDGGASGVGGALQEVGDDR